MVFFPVAYVFHNYIFELNDFICESRETGESQLFDWLFLYLDKINKGAMYACNRME